MCSISLLPSDIFDIVFDKLDILYVWSVVTVCADFRNTASLLIRNPMNSVPFKPGYIPDWTAFVDYLYFTGKRNKSVIYQMCEGMCLFSNGVNDIVLPDFGTEWDVSVTYGLL